MKIKSAFLICFFVLIVHAAFGNVSGCTNGPNFADGSGGYFAQYSCTLYREPSSYTLSLEPYFDVPAASVSENYIVPGYVVFSSDATDVTNNTLNDTAAFHDVLYFAPDVAAGTASDEVQLFWSNTGFPSVGNMQALGYEVLAYNPSGTDFLSLSAPPDQNVNFTVQSPVVPEPSYLPMLLLGFTAGLGVLIVRRRSRSS
jgi:hypothetical protein